MRICIEYFDQVIISISYSCVEFEKMITERNFTLFFEKIGPGVTMSDNARSALSAMTDAKIKKKPNDLKARCQIGGHLSEVMKGYFLNNFQNYRFILTTLLIVLGYVSAL